MNSSRTPLSEIIASAMPAKREARVYAPLGILGWYDFLHLQWMRRECFICGKFGQCRHRQPDAECVAEFEALKRRAS